MYEADKATAESFMAKLMEGFGEQHRECDVIFCKSGNWQLCSKTNTVGGCCRAHLPKHGFHTAFPAECVGDETPAVHSGFARVFSPLCVLCCDAEMSIEKGTYCYECGRGFCEDCVLSHAGPDVDVDKSLVMCVSCDRRGSLLAQVNFFYLNII